MFAFLAPQDKGHSVPRGTPFHGLRYPFPAVFQKESGEIGSSPVFLRHLSAMDRYPVTKWFVVPRARKQGDPCQT